MLTSFSGTSPEFLSSYGWNGFFENQLESISVEGTEHVLARIVGEEKSLYRAQVSLDLTLPATLSGKLRHETSHRERMPAVGDWVVCQVSGEMGVIKHVLERKSMIARKTVGAKAEAQILATNVDTFFIATSLNEDLNPRRLERYLTIGWDSRAVPVILLTKADLHDDPEGALEDLRAEFPGVDIHALTAKDTQTLESLKPYLRLGTTAVIAGSSGVGKSTLTNLLLGEEVLLTQEIREHDGRGRHTTTSRYLFRSPLGGLIIDTPGMRELQLLDHEEGLSQQFADVEALTRTCKFTDCGHGSEPGCAVKRALANGELEPGRWESFQKLLREIAFAMRKVDRALAAEEKAKWKKIHKEAAEHTRLKKRHGY